MNLHTIRKTILCSTELIGNFYSYLESFKSYDGLNEIMNY